MAKSVESPALSFVHQVLQPPRPSGEVLVLLHGSGGDETTLVPLARQVAPAATLLAVRGRIVQEGVSRWYRRVTPVEFDQADIRTEAAAFGDFVTAACEAYGFDPDRITYLGYSNGGNLVAAMALLRPGMVRRAVLLRVMAVLEGPPPAALGGARLLIVAGRDDTLYAPFAPALGALLHRNGAHVEEAVVAAGHMLEEADAQLVATWLAAGSALSMNID